LIRHSGLVILVSMRSLAIDLGSRRVGLALSDEGGRFATPYDVLQVTSPEMATAAIVKVIEREGVEQLVVGLPLNMDDSIGPQAKKTIEWGRALATLASKPVVFIDERLSSFSAEQHLLDRKRGGEHITRQRKKEQLDAIAAASFLQEFLDGKLSPQDV
jgi:putative Holliday junction resolvase